MSDSKRRSVKVAAFRVSNGFVEFVEFRAFDGDFVVAKVDVSLHNDFGNGESRRVELSPLVTDIPTVLHKFCKDILAANTLKVGRPLAKLRSSI